MPHNMLEKEPKSQGLGPFWASFSSEHTLLHLHLAIPLLFFADCWASRLTIFGTEQRKRYTRTADVKRTPKIGTLLFDTHSH
jgi:hypothetical protein